MYPDFKNYDEYNHYILSYASNQDVAELEKKIDDVQKDQEGQSDIPLVDGKIPASYLPSNMVTTGEDGKITVDKLPESVVTVGDDGTIPSSKLPSYVDDVVDVDTLPETGETGKIYITAENKQYRWTGSQFAEITSGGVVIGDVTGTAYDGGKGVALEGRVTTIEDKFANYPTKEEMDVAVNAIDEKVTTLEGKAVTYSDFSYVPGGETEPVERKTIQLANYDSISGMNTAGNDAANLIMMSKWDKVDIGSSRYPVNLNGSEFTLNDNRDIAKVYETNGLTDLSEGASDNNIRSALGLDFDKLIEIIQDKDVVIIDRTSIGDYKTCIHATGNISGGNGAANLMFFIGTTPTIYQVQYVSGTFALAVNKYEFAKKDEIPDVSNLATKDEIPTDYQKKIVASTAKVDEDASGEMKIGVAFSDTDEGQSMDLTFTNFRWPQYIRLNPRTYDKKIYSAEEIYAFFGVSDVVGMRSVVSRGGMFILNFGIASASVGNMLYNIPVQYIEVEGGSDTPKIIVKAWGPNSSDDKLSQYTITMNTDGTAIGDTNCNIGIEIEPIQQ